MAKTLEDDFPLVHSDVLELLDYDIETGVFTWKKQRRGVRVGIPLGTCNGFGYLRITVLGQSYYAHRLAWFYVHGFWPKNEVDHINSIRSDNRICNLREATTSENQHYKFMSTVAGTKKRKTKVLGVSWHAKARKWQAHCKTAYLGLFTSISEASDAYRAAKEKYISAKDGS